MSEVTTTQAAYEVARRGLYHLLGIKPVAHEISVIASEIHGVELLLIALGDEAAAAPLASLSDELASLATQEMSDYHPYLRRMLNRLEVARV